MSDEGHIGNEMVKKQMKGMEFARFSSKKDSTPRTKKGLKHAMSAPADPTSVSPFLVLSCLVLCCPVLSCLVLSGLVWSCIVLCYLVSCLALPCVVLACLILSCDCLCLVFVFDVKVNEGGLSHITKFTHSSHLISDSI
jgi:hypothetical protein